MKVTVDTNVLVRAATGDNLHQARLAYSLLKDAEIVAIPLPCLCELVWVLRRVYGLGHSDIHGAIETLIRAGNVSVDRQAVSAGLAVLAAGGDFADGLIAYEGRWLGGETFTSFDKKAVALIQAQGLDAQLLT